MIGVSDAFRLHRSDDDRTRRDWIRGLDANDARLGQRAAEEAAIIRARAALGTDGVVEAVDLAVTTSSRGSGERAGPELPGAALRPSGC